MTKKNSGRKIVFIRQHIPSEFQAIPKFQNKFVPKECPVAKKLFFLTIFS